MGWLGNGQQLDFNGLANDRAGNLTDQTFFASPFAIALIIGFFRGVKWSQFFDANLPYRSAISEILTS